MVTLGLSVSMDNVLFEVPIIGSLVHMRAVRIRMNVGWGSEQGSEQLFKCAGSKNNISGREDTIDSVPNLCVGRVLMMSVGVERPDDVIGPSRMSTGSTKLLS